MQRCSSATAGWRRRLHFAWINLFPSAGYMRQRYRLAYDALLPLCYPYRWALGLRSWARVVVRRSK